jgi:predicted DNA-binding transcriptional regulator YafY
MPDTTVTANLAVSRRAVNDRYKLGFCDTRADGESTSRTVHPLGFFYWGHSWTLVGWCEKRDDFRNFRLDRMEQLVRRDEKFEDVEGCSLNDFRALRR